jgi:hypothetical protein
VRRGRLGFGSTLRRGIFEFGSNVRPGRLGFGSTVRRFGGFITPGSFSGGPSCKFRPRERPS